MQPQAAELAGRIGDSLVNVAPKKEIVEKFEEGGGDGKAKYGQITVCYAKSKDNAKRTAFEIWPNALVEGSASQELPLPSDFEQLVRGREADELEGTLTLGPDVDEYIDKVKEYDKAGYTHVYFHHVGPDQDAFWPCATSCCRGSEPLPIEGIFGLHLEPSRQARSGARTAVRGPGGRRGREV